MTWSRTAVTAVGVTAYHVKIGEVEKVRLMVGSSMVDLSEEDAASLGGYLLGTSNDAPENPGKKEND